MSRPIVLCHGAFADASAWERVAPALHTRTGAAVTTVTLPGHGDGVAPGAVSLDDYVAALLGAIDAQPEPVLLVGHSMGGVAITQTAERRSDGIAALVYLSAYLPENGKALIDYAQDPESKLGPGLQIDQALGQGTITRETMQAAFFNNTPAADAEAQLARLRPEPLRPFVTPVQTSAERFGSVPRYYITTLQDRAVGPSLQAAMIAAQPPVRVDRLDTDHSSYFSATDALVDLIAAIHAERSDHAVR